MGQEKDTFIGFLELEIRASENSIRNGIENIQNILHSVGMAVDGGQSLNDLGALQSTATIFDAEVAKLATLRKVLAEYLSQGPAMALTRKQLYNLLIQKKLSRAKDERCDTLAQTYQAMRDAEIELLAQIFDEDPDAPVEKTDRGVKQCY